MLSHRKKRGFKSFVGGFSSLFSSQGRRRDDHSIGHDFPASEGPSQLHPSPPLKDGGSMTGPATLAPDAENLSTVASAHEKPLLPVEQSSSLSMFSNSQRFNVERVHIDSSQHVHHAQGNRVDGWKTLLKNVASSALHDSSARFDPPKCDEDTRVEVTKELMEWLEDREGPQRLLCMTGAAGAGKSALQQTIAEKCSSFNILGSAFFFSAEDPTRNDLTRVVPTVAYQLGLRNSALRDNIATTIEEDPLIFKRNIKTQMQALIVAPFQHLCGSGKVDRNTFPHVILFDGLDECVGEENQAELLSSLKTCLLDTGLPFRTFIASRPEWAIRSTLESDPEGYLYRLAYHIKLSDQYDATGDIRRYLWRRIRDIGARSHDRRARSPFWPTEEDIEKLVAAASGQFVYAATVVKYLSEHRSSPVDRLRTIIEWTPDGDQQARPFEALDTLYRNILSTAKVLYEAIDRHRGRDFLLLFRAHQTNANYRFAFETDVSLFDDLLGLEDDANVALMSDLHSLVFRQEVVASPRYTSIHFYHHSFSEFLDSESRAQNLFVSEMRVRKYVAESCLQKLLQREYRLDDIDFNFRLIFNALIRHSDNHVAHVDPLRLIDFTRNNGWAEIDDKLPDSDYVMEENPDKRRDYLHSPALGAWARFTLEAISRLKDELHEEELADIVKSYYKKWEDKFRIRPDSPPGLVL
ncbi:hypothetical protein MD484_g1030, partial [Candolleomyces efflorescens]